LELSEIEAIVAEIEREKEAGKLDGVTLVVPFTYSRSSTQRPSARDHDWQQLLQAKPRWLRELQRARVPVNSSVSV
jgi:hypothetical protein